MTRPSRQTPATPNDVDEHSITAAVVASFAQTPDPRLRTVMASLVRHLHDFAREVNLSEDEWLAAIRFLTAVGQTSDDKRQEFILLSDTLGLSTLVTAQSQRKPPGCTEPTVVGPFYVADAPEFANGADLRTRSRTTAPSGRCSGRPAGIPGGRRTCTS